MKTMGQEEGISQGAFLEEEATKELRLN